MERKPGAGTESGSAKARLLPLEIRVLRTIRKHGMIQPGDHILLAVSGGADSMALLLCLHRLVPWLGIGLSVAHLNHGLRGSESDSDEAFVRAASEDLGLPFQSEALPAGKLASAESKNLEEAARDARYEFLRRTARLVGASRIAVGHSMNDQAETVLLRLFRGSGIEGLSAIHPVVGGTIIRPLLECSRAEIMDYLSNRSVKYREDSSNCDLRFRRNRVRHEWIPYLERAFNPGLIHTLAREAEFARELMGFLEPIASAEYESLKTGHDAAIFLPVDRINNLPVAIRKMVLRLALRETRGSLRGITARHIEEVCQLCRPGRSGRRIQLPGGICAVREFQNLAFLSAPPPTGRSFCYPVPIPGRCVVPEAGVEFCVSVEKSSRSPERSHRVFLNADSLPGSLVARSRRPGDRYGGPGHRKIKKMLIDERVGLRARATLPVIAAGDIVVWVPGFEPAKPFRGQPECGQCVVVEMRKLGS